MSRGASIAMAATLSAIQVALSALNAGLEKPWIAAFCAFAGGLWTATLVYTIGRKVSP